MARSFPVRCKHQSRIFLDKANRLLIKFTAASAGLKDKLEINQTKPWFHLELRLYSFIMTSSKSVLEYQKNMKLVAIKFSEVSKQS